MKRPGVLYISYDGMLEPLGQSQVITYLERLSQDHRVHVLSFEKPEDRARADKVAAVEARMESAGISWHPLTYHKRPTVPATLFDVTQGLFASLWLVLRHRLGLIHARSYVSALIAWLAKLLTGTPYIFDMRGFWPDERADGGIWPREGRIYRAVKKIERVLLRGADHIVTLTHASKGVIEGFPFLQGGKPVRVTVIPTCADLARFSPGERRADNPYVLGYLGSIGTWYLFDEVIACFAALRRRLPDARLLVVNRNEQDLVRRLVAEAGLPESAVEITAADHAEVPAQVRRMSAGAAIIKPVYSKLASAPTKLAEYLGCGVPCLGNVDVGDMEMMLEGEGGGVALRAFTDAEREAAVDRLLALHADPETPARCRAAAERHFSVEQGAEDYRAIYRSLLA